MTTGLELFLLGWRWGGDGWILSGGDGEGSCRIGASHTISTTSILSNHSSTLVLPSTQNSEKSEKSNCFFPSYESKSSLPTTCTQFTTNSIPIHYINSHLKIQLLWRHFEKPLSFTLLFYSHGHSSSPLLNRTLLSFRCLTTKEPPLLYLNGSLFATLFFHTSSIHYPLTHIHKPLLSPFCSRFFLSQPHLIAIFITIVSLPMSLYILLLIFYPADKNCPNPKKVKFHFILPMASFHRKNLPSYSCFP